MTNVEHYLEHALMLYEENKNDNNVIRIFVTDKILLRYERLTSTNIIDMYYIVQYMYTSFLTDKLFEKEEELEKKYGYKIKE